MGRTTRQKVDRGQEWMVREARRKFMDGMSMIEQRKGREKEGKEREW